MTGRENDNDKRLNETHFPHSIPDSELGNMWDSESPAHLQMGISNVMNFASSSGVALSHEGLSSPDQSRRSSQQLEAKVDMVYSLLAMLGGQETADMGETLLALSTNPESCLAMRQSGCLPLLVQLVQSDGDSETRKKAAEALYNLVHSQPDEKLRKREARILKILETVSAYTEALESDEEFLNNKTIQDDIHPVQIVSQMMKFSFDEGHRQAICQLGGIHVIAKLVEIEHSKHGSVTEDVSCNLLRRYACMVLTNLTFGDSGNKALLCSYKDFIRALIAQLKTTYDDLRQVTASVLRNLSWRADSTSKEILREVGSVRHLMNAAMLDNKENTLISILSALWNLSAHCKENKSEICSVNGALEFLVQMLSYKSSSDSLAVIENSGGILRNISSHISGREDYRIILRKHNCLQTLLMHLESTNLTVISNACGILWNLSSQNTVDQELLCSLGAPDILKSLNNSKHKIIAMGSSATLKNLLNMKSNRMLPEINSSKPLEPLVNSSEIAAVCTPLPQNSIQYSSKTICQNNSTLWISEQKVDMSPIFVKKSYDVKSSSFASLNIHEQTGSLNHKRRFGMLQGCGSSSLPYVNSSKCDKYCSTLATGNEYFVKYGNETESSENQYDFSRRYSESRRPNNVTKNKCSKDANYKYEEPKNDENFSIYAETDLDQPTDYSLRYAEDDSDSDSEVCENVEKTAVGFVRDTVKTYCTEGTPYETPFNFSTSTSMSDLRTADKNITEIDKLNVKDSKNNEVELSTDKPNITSVKDMAQPQRQQSQISKMKSEFSSGLMSPEKPMNYCEEGTPGYFSRVSSFGSLNSAPVPEERKSSTEKHICESAGVSSKDDKIHQKMPDGDAKVKVKFESNVNYYEETPLMFSRSSSLGSLGSMEQHSIQDDRSSVVSDFSRLTSGIISPSELPDSPTQTVPPSPRPQKISEFSNMNRRLSGDGRPQSSIRRLMTKVSVFEDGLTKFKEENTPTQFSVATSLSSLTIDDPDEPQESSENNMSRKNRTSSNSEYKKYRNNTHGESSDCAGFRRKVPRESIQQKRQQLLRPEASSRSTLEGPSNFAIYATDRGTSLSTILPRTHSPGLPNDNAVHTYCTEDTPAVLSHNGSISDLSLSTLSMLDEEPPLLLRPYVSENNSESSGKNENALVNQRHSDTPPNRKKVENVWERRELTNLPCRHATGESSGLSPYLTARDELSMFAVEDSPMQFSVRSSLSNLTIESDLAHATKVLPIKKQTSPKVDSKKIEIETPSDMNGNLPEMINSPFEDSDNFDDSSCRDRLPRHSSTSSVQVIDEYDTIESPLVSNIERTVHSDSDHTPGLSEPKFEQPISYGSFKRRKWKWKWKLGSEGSKQNDQRETTPQTECTSPCNERLDFTELSDVTDGSKTESYTKSLDASYKKKKWWRWKFGSKEAEQLQLQSSDKTEVPHNSSDNFELRSNARRAVSLDPHEGTSSRNDESSSETSNFSSCRSKSKRWKWRWKVGKAENSSIDKLTASFSKLKHTVSPTTTRKEKEDIDRASLHQPLSLDHQRESRQSSVRINSKKLPRSISEPRGNKNNWGVESEADYTNTPATLTHSIIANTQSNTNEPDAVSDSTDIDKSRQRTADTACSSLATNIHPQNNHSDQEILTKKNNDTTKQYALLVEECIQLGMSKMKAPEEADVPSTFRSTDTEKSRILPSINSVKHMTMHEECVQLEPKKNIDISEPRNKNKPSNEMVEITKKNSQNHIDPNITEASNISRFRMSKRISDSCRWNGANSVSSKSEDINSPMTQKTSYKIDKNDLEFLKRQLNLSDKRLLKETIEKGISKEEETFLVETLIVNRVRNETKKSKEDVGFQHSSDDGSSHRKHAPTSQSGKDGLMMDTEELLDPVTLSIIKRILRHRFSESENDMMNEVLKEANLEYDGSSHLENESNSLPESSRSLPIVEESGRSISLIKTAKGSPIIRTSDKSSMANKKINVISNSITKKEDMIERPSDVENKNFAALIEECIQLGMPKKKAFSQQAIYANVSLSPGYSKSNSVSKYNVQKEFSSEVDSVKNIGVVSPLNGAIQKSSSDPQKLVEECIQLGMPKRNDISEEAIYANVPVSPGYSRTNSMQRRGDMDVLEKSKGMISSVGSTRSINAQSLVEECIKMGMPKKKEDNAKEYSNEVRGTSLIEKCSAFGVNPNYKSLLKECIQKGMPRTEEESKSVVEHKSIGENSGSTFRSQNANMNETKKDKTRNYLDLVEECIQFGMPSKRDQEEAIYANTTERYSTFKSTSKIAPALVRSSPKRMVRSGSEPGSSRIPFDSFGNDRVESSFLTSSSAVDRTREGFSDIPRNRETITISKTVNSKVVSEYSRVISMEQVHETGPKNVDVASVARNTPEYHHVHSKIPAMVTDAEEDSERLGEINMTELQGTSLTLADQERNGFDNENYDNMEEVSEISFASLGDVDTSLLDPVVMLESLDRYTAELIAQAELRLQLNNYKQARYPTNTSDSASTSIKTIGVISRKKKLKSKTVNFKIDIA